MADYKETTVSGTSYVRCHTVTILNPLNGVKAANFAEEEVINLNGKQIREGSGGFQIPFVAENADTEIALLNPETGAPLGASMTYQQLYVALYSLYIAGALVRDAAAEQARLDAIAAEEARVAAAQAAAEAAQAPATTPDPVV